MFTYIYDYSISALIFLLIITVHYFSKRQFKNPPNRIFTKTLLFALADNALDIASSVVIERVAEVPLPLTYSICSVYYALQVVFPALMLRYTLAVISEADGRRGPRAAFVYSLSLIFVASLVANIFAPVVFYVENGIYKRAFMFYGMYASSGVYIFATFAALIINRRKLRRSYFVTLLAVSTIITAAMLIQIKLPRYMLTSISVAVSMTLQYLVMSKPENMLDSLTGAFNREAMMIFLREAIRDGRKRLLVVTDLNNLRAINGLFGYTNGNTAICDIAEFLKANTRTWTFRLMSGKFVTVCDDESDYQALVDAIRVRFKMPWNVMGVNMPLSVTAMAVRYTQGITSPVDLLNLVETMLSEMPAGRVTEVDKAIIERFKRASIIGEALQTGIESSGLDVYFQPIYCYASQRFASVEALARLRHPELGMIPPDEFIPLAEKTGQIFALDEYIVRRTLSFLAERPEIDVEGVEINLSAAQFVRPALAERLVSIIRETGIDARRVIFEITETVASTNNEYAKELMLDLKKAGVRFALDDFGKGYANAMQVLNLPFDIVKMDRDMLSTDNGIMYQHTARMFTEMGLKVVAEGIESEEQDALARSSGVSDAQGYKYARPMPGAEYEKMMRGGENAPH